MHAASVSAITGAPQAHLLPRHHDARMKRDFTSAAERVAWAIERSERTKTDIGQAIGCSHATLSQWATGATDLANVKVHLIVAFADELGISLDWLLTGNGQAVSTYRSSAPPLVLLAQDICEGGGDQAATAERLLRALRPPQ